MIESLFYIDLLKTNEQYVMDLPNIYINGIFWGTSEIQVGGDLKITGKNFKSKIHLDAYSGAISGDISNGKDQILYKIDGNLLDKIYLEKDGKRTLFYDKSEIKFAKAAIKDLELLEENHSRKKWHEFVLNVYKNNSDGAQKEKSKIEEKEREERRKREENNIEWKPKFFEKQSGHFWFKNGLNRPLEITIEKGKGLFSRWFS